MSDSHAPIVGELHAEPDRHALRSPALGGLADDAFPVLERGVSERRSSWLEVHVVRDRKLGDASLEGGRRVEVDRDVAVGRQVRVEVGVERQVPRLTIDHLWGPSGGTTINPR